MTAPALARARAFEPSKSIKPEYPDYEIEIDGRVRRVTDRALIERPMEETVVQKEARAKTGEPAPMLSYMVGRIVW